MTWVNAVVQGVLLGGQYAILACGLSFMFGVMRIVNLAHGTIAVSAAYVAYWLSDAVGLPTAVALVVTIPVFAAIGYLLQRGLFNRALNEGELEPLLVSFGLSIVVVNLLQEGFSADSRHISAGSLETASLTITDDISVGWFSLLILLLAVLVIAGIELFLRRSAPGRAMRATSDDPETARVMGINNAHVYGLATAIAIATVALAGVVIGMSTLFTPGYGDLVLIFAFEAVIIGGLGSLWGTLAGAVVLGVAQTVGAQVDPAWGILAGHIAFLAVLLVRPQGLMSRVMVAAS
jgi:branched-chain amino acid transport system permease protein